MVTTAAPAQSTRIGQLLGLVRVLIDYGRQLASTLQHRTSATDLRQVTRHFGTADLRQILARIANGLLRAAALEARLVSRSAREPATRAALPTASLRQPRARPEPGLVPLPTPEDIAAEARRRPIGAVLADICRDFGIVPSHPLWRELSLAVIANGGNLGKLFKDTCERVGTWLLQLAAAEHPAELPPDLPMALAPGTGPP